MDIVELVDKPDLAIAIKDLRKSFDGREFVL
jgi:hypothetical protein